MINYTRKRLVLSLNILICIFFSAMSSASEEHHAEQPESLAYFYSQEFNEEHTDHDDHIHDGEHGHGHETEQHDNHADHNDEHHHEESTTIPPHIAKQVGIATKQAGPAELKHQVTAYGTLTTAPEQLSHVRARFPGVIYSVKANIGDRVTQGDLLAEIESNESLKRYAIRAPISGTIIQRHANAGEMTREQELFSIARFDSLWAELKVFPSQKQKIQAGQTVDIVLDKISTAATISHLVPTDDNKPYVLARVEVTNGGGELSPGILVEGRITTSTQKVNLAVETTAIQTLPDGTGVFVKQGDNYVFKPLTLGASDNSFTEVLNGLHAGDQYVAENSFILKADILKAGAEHVH